MFIFIYTRCALIQKQVFPKMEKPFKYLYLSYKYILLLIFFSNKTKIALETKMELLSYQACFHDCMNLSPFIYRSHLQCALTFINCICTSFEINSSNFSCLLIAFLVYCLFFHWPAK